jgi:hypothetical protein
VDSPADDLAAPRPASAGSPGDRLAWGAVAGLLLLQYLLFCGHVRGEIAPFYPRMFDQSGYLSATYGLHEAVRDQGLAAVPALAWQRRLPQSLLFTCEAALFLFVAGPSRLGALSFVFLHFALLQLGLAAVLRRLSGGWSVPAVGLGLLLSARTAFGWGGLTDFRIDLSADCLVGLFLCLVLWSNGLARRGSWLLVGGAALYLALFRYVAIPQVVGTLVLLGAFAGWAVRRATQDRRARAQLRFRNTLRALALTVAGLAAVLWANLGLLRDYYWAGQHLAADQHSFGLKGSEAWLYYVRSLAQDHAGPAFLALAAATLLVSPLLARGSRPAPEAAAPPASSLPELELLPATLVLAASIAVPMVVLTLNPARSPVVAGAMLPALALLVTLAPLALARRHPGSLARRALAGLGAAVLATGLWTHADALVKRLPDSERAQSAAATQLLSSLAQVSREMDWHQPVVFFDSTTEFQQPWALAVVAYERYGFLLEPVVPIGAPAFKPAVPAAVGRVFGSADLAFLARRRPAWYVANFAYDRSVDGLRPDLLARAEREMELVGRGNVGDWSLEAYARPSARMVEPVVPAGSSWTWITDAGLRLRTSVHLLRARPRIRLSGTARFDFLGGELPGLRATLVPDDGAPLPLRVSGRATGVHYTVDISCDPRLLPRQGSLAVQLDFDRSFSPRELGLSNDERRLVMASPSRIRLLRAGAPEAAPDESP